MLYTLVVQLSQNSKCRSINLCVYVGGNLNSGSYKKWLHLQNYYSIVFALAITLWQSKQVLKSERYTILLMVTNLFIYFFLNFQVRGGVSLWAGARELCFRKGLLYGLMRCLSIPFKTLQGAGQSLGVTRLMCNVSCISTALQIELVS